MKHVIAVAGNPNCGKTTLFNAITGSRQKVGNWPGVTVEKKTGTYRHGGVVYDIVDLPGVYMIGGATGGSEDERVARDYIVSGEPQVVVNIIDAVNIERNLYLTSQLLEMRVPVIVALNMTDMAERNGLVIDYAALSHALDCPVVPMVASRGKGIAELKAAIAEVVAAPRVPVAQPVHPAAVRQAVATLAGLLQPAARRHDVNPEWVALKLVEGDSFAESVAGPSLAEAVEDQRQAIIESTNDDPDIVIADSRYEFIAEVMAASVHQAGRLSATLSHRLDAVVLNRFLGVPVFLLAMYLMFLFTINIGGAFIDFFDQATGAILVDGLGDGLTSLGAPELVTVILTGFGSGIQTVATFVPIIACLFLFLSFLEDSGYMARAAFVMDRAMRAIGLPGKSFVPLIVGFGCNVPAIMATRTLESRRDRVMTSMMAPFMSCGARLPVFALFAAAFFPTNGQNVVFALYLLGIVFAILTGLILKGTLLPGKPTPFVMELPPYHMPTARTVLLQAWQRLRDFVFRAGQVIVPMVMILSFLNAVGTDGSFGKEDTQDSVLSYISQEITPIFTPMGLTEENWPAAVGLFTGIFAKEAVVGTLNALYGQVADADAAAAGAPVEAAPSMGEALAEAVATIPENLLAVIDSLTDPLGINVGYVSDAAASAAELEVDTGVFGAMVSRFDGTAGAFAYMLLILLYTPCVAALGAIRHEAGLGWTVFSAVWTTGIGYVTSITVYQAAVFSRDPMGSGLTLAVCGAGVALAVAVMWFSGRVQGRRMQSPMPAE